MSFRSSSSKNYSSSGQSTLGDKVFAFATLSSKLKFSEKKMKVFRHKIPELDQKVKYSIYRWKYEDFPHEALVMGYNEKFFTLEISFVDKILTVYATAVDKNTTAWEYCESIITTGEELIFKAAKAFRAMKGYNILVNNCQDFVNRLLKEIGLSDKVRMTDPERIFMAVVGPKKRLTCKKCQKWNSFY